MKRVKKDRFESRMKSIIKAQVDDGIWGKVGDVTEQTGWNNRKMTKARKYRWITFRVVDGKYEYDLTSIPQQFIKR